MQYRKHNIYKNLVTAATIDTKEGWRVLLNEVNELAVDQPSKLVAALTAAKIKVSAKPAAKTVANLVVSNLYNNTDLRSQLATAIDARHKDPYVTAGGVVGTPAELSLAITKIVTATDGPDKKEVTKMLVANLDSKLKQRGLNASFKPLKFLIVGSLLAGAGYLAYKVFYKNQAVI